MLYPAQFSTFKTTVYFVLLSRPVATKLFLTPFILQFPPLQLPLLGGGSIDKDKCSTLILLSRFQCKLILVRSADRLKKVGAGGLPIICHKNIV